MKVKLIDHAYGRQMNAKYSNLYTTGMIPAKMYPGQDKDNAIAVVQNILVANAKMADKVTNIVRPSSKDRTSSSPYMRRRKTSRSTINPRRTHRSRGIPAR